MISSQVADSWVGKVGAGALSDVLSRVVRPEPTNLLKRAQNGETVAVERLIELYQDSIYAMAVSFTRNPHQAEDLAQEAWIKVLGGLPRFRHDSKFSTWLYRVTMNTFLNAYRSIKREQEIVGTLSADSLDSDETQAGLEVSLDLHHAVRQLPFEFRSVVLLRFVADLSYKEIAAVLELPLGTVQSRLKRALDKLNQNLEHEGYRSAL